MFPALLLFISISIMWAKTELKEKELFYNDCKYGWVLCGTFTLNFFLYVDLWKIFIKLNYFSIRSHFLVLGPGTLSYVLLGTFYLHYRRILSDERLLFFSITVKFLKEESMRSAIPVQANITTWCFIPMSYLLFSVEQGHPCV